MDAMALLCTLHADGPATLKVLRQSGCASLAEIESMGEESLARLLGGPPAAARRFAREARHLRERLGQGMLEREEPPAESRASVPGSSAPASAETDPSAPPGDIPATGILLSSKPEAEEDASPDREERDVVEVVLDTWRARDLEDALIEEAVEPSPAYEDDLPPRPVRARPEYEFGIEMAAAVREIASAIAPTEVESSPGLAPGLVDGLNEDLCRMLDGARVRSLEDLASADSLTLSHDLGLGYTRLWRLTRLARRVLAAEASAATAPSTGPAEPSRSYASAPDSAPPALKLSPSEVPHRSEPSILDLEWNLEIQPTPPPPGRELPSADVPRTERESAGGPFA
jgi:hypothetical protein